MQSDRAQCDTHGVFVTYENINIDRVTKIHPARSLKTITNRLWGEWQSNRFVYMGFDGDGACECQITSETERERERV